MINKASELGPQIYSWWPDWRGECCAIIGSGPTIKKMDLNILRNRIHVIAIKVNVELIPWAEICYGCDAAWWISKNGVPHKHFSGIKICHGSQAWHFPNMCKVDIELGTDEMLVEKPLKIGNGGNSAHQALNLAIQFGAKDIILLGIDCKSKDEDHHYNHWYGRNKWSNANNPIQNNYNRWMRGFDIAKKTIDKLGVNVINCSPDSALKTFKKATLEQTLEEWGL